MTTITVVVPCYNEEETIHSFYNEAERVRLQDFSDIARFEYIFVDDGSKDRTVELLKGLSEKNPNVKYISFSRNFGKESAIIAGLEAATGEYVTLMDADLQDPPSILREMYDSIVNEGYDQVGTRRVTRKGEPFLRTLCAKAFYKIINRISTVPMVDGARDYMLMKRCVVDAICSLPEKCRYSKGIFNFVGFKTKWLEYENVERVAGTTKWSFWGLFKYAVNGIVSYSTVPLSALSVVGIISFIAALVFLVLAISLDSLVMTIITASLFICGSVFVASGIIGLYLSQTFFEIKNRPAYIVRETNIENNR